MKKDKVYLADIRLGMRTESGDLDGNIVSESDYSHVTNEKIKDVCAGFIGEIEQIPPMFSALKVGGRKLYELARKGIEIERKARKIMIYSIDILDMSECAKEMQISDKMLGYIFAMLDEYAVEITFNENSCHIEYESKL